MAPSIDSIIETPARTRIRVGLAPAKSAVHSLMLLTKTEKLSGLGDWVINTAHQLSPEEREQHYRVMIAFYHAIMPERRWSSFPVYLDYLRNTNPEKLRDKMLNAYFKLDPHKASEKFTRETVMDSEENYVSFLKERFGEENVDEELEGWAYKYALDPPAMQELITSHLQRYWDDFLAAEWERTLPTLKKAVKAFQLVDFSHMDNLEAAEYITGQSLASDWGDKCQNTENLYFAPSLHVGPYVGKFFEENLLGFFFGARLPDNASIHAPELSQAEIYVRLNALADETRLEILSHVGEKGESCSTEIIETLGMSQSATSRHLTQLTAAGFLSTRRLDGAKCYKLNKERIANTLDTVKSFLLT
jgi:DNA-binding transcriptional ArsR family regulator